MQERFKLEKVDFPADFLYKKGAEGEPIRYVGFPDSTAVKPTTWDDEEDGPWEPPMLADVNLETLSTWLHQHGINVPAVGTITALDEVAKRVMKDGLKDTDLEEAKKLANGEYKDNKKAQIYVKIMEKVQDKGVEYIEKETARIRKIMVGQMSPEKSQDMKDKLSILRVFTT